MESRTSGLLTYQFDCSSLEDFIDRHGADLSKGGVFLRSEDPAGVGTALRFELSLGPDAPLLAGEGTVLWSRAPGASANRSSGGRGAALAPVPGMGLRFDRLTPDSQQRLGRILAEKRRRGDGQSPSRFEGGADQAPTEDSSRATVKVAPERVVELLKSAAAAAAAEQRATVKVAPERVAEILASLSSQASHETTAAAASLNSIDAQTQTEGGSDEASVRVTARTGEAGARRRRLRMGLAVGVLGLALLFALAGLLGWWLS